MAKYYNTTRGPLAVRLNGGLSVPLAAKAWTVVKPEQEGSEDLVRYLSKGFLVRSTVDDEVVEAPKSVEPTPATSESTEVKVKVGSEEVPQTINEKPLEGKRKKS